MACPLCRAAGPESETASQGHPRSENAMPLSRRDLQENSTGVHGTAFVCGIPIDSCFRHQTHTGRRTRSTDPSQYSAHLLYEYREPSPPPHSLWLLELPDAVEIFCLAQSAGRIDAMPSGSYRGLLMRLRHSFLGSPVRILPNFPGRLAAFVEIVQLLFILECIHRGKKPVVFKSG